MCGGFTKLTKKESVIFFFFSFQDVSCRKNREWVSVVSII